MELSLGLEQEFLWLHNDEPQSPPFQHWTNESLSFSLGKESHQGVLEIISRVYQSPKALINHIYQSRSWLQSEAKKRDCKVLYEGTHRKLDWHQVRINEEKIYQNLLEKYQLATASSFVFGMHLHIGNIEETQVSRIFNTLRTYIPLLIAISCNSLYWRGIKTGLSSNRMFRLDMKPRSGLPPTMISVEQCHQQLIDMRKTETIGKLTSIWEDIRWHPIHKTIEIRVFDTASTSQETACIVFFTYLLVRDIANDTHGKYALKTPEDWILKENRWRSIRYGMQANYILADLTTIPAIDLILSIFEIHREEFQTQLGANVVENFKKHLVTKGT